MAYISVVIPVYRAENYLYELYQRLTRSLETVCDDFEIVLVEDGSRDRSWRIIAELGAKDQRVKGIKLSRNFGQHPAISAGFEQATGDFIVLMDCDLQDRPEDIPILLSHLQGEIDIVYTIKEGDLGGFMTRLSSQLYHYTFSRIVKVSVPENIGTFRMFNRKFLNAVLQYPERNILFGPLMFYVGFNSTCVAVQHESRSKGRSTYSFTKRLTLAINSLISYTDIPHRVLMTTGFIISICSILYILLLVVEYLIQGRVLVQGLTFVIALITMSMGLTMFGLGIIGSYVFRVYQEILRRPRYLVSQTVNIVY